VDVAGYQSRRYALEEISRLVLLYVALGAVGQAAIGAIYAGFVGERASA